MTNKYKTYFIIAVIVLFVLVIILLDSYSDTKSNLESWYIPLRNVDRLPVLNIGVNNDVTFWSENEILRDSFDIDDDMDWNKIDGFSKEVCKREFDKRPHYEKPVSVGIDSTGNIIYPLRECWIDYILNNNNKPKVTCSCYYATKINDN